MPVASEQILERFKQKLIVVYDCDRGFLLGLHKTSDNIEPVHPAFEDIGTPYKSLASVEIKTHGLSRCVTGSTRQAPDIVDANGSLSDYLFPMRQPSVCILW